VVRRPFATSALRGRVQPQRDLARAVASRSSSARRGWACLARAIDRLDQLLARHLLAVSGAAEKRSHTLIRRAAPSLGLFSSGPLADPGVGSLCACAILAVLSDGPERVPAIGFERAARRHCPRRRRPKRGYPVAYPPCFLRLPGDTRLDRRRRRARDANVDENPSRSHRRALTTSPAAVRR
jgi:hypothetical protein